MTSPTCSPAAITSQQTNEINRNLQSTRLRKAHVWEVTSPVNLSINAIGKGQPHFLPTQLTPANRRWRVSVEIHKVQSLFEDAAVGADDNDDDPLGGGTEICYVRILSPATTSILPVETIVDPIAKLFGGETKKKEKKTVNFFTGSYRPNKEEEDIDDDASMGDGSFMK